MAPYEWTNFFRTRLDSVEPNTPDESLNNSGWKLVYNDQPNDVLDEGDAAQKQIDVSLSIGLQLSEDGTVADVIYDGPSYKAGIGPGMKVIAVSGRRFPPRR